MSGLYAYVTSLLPSVEARAIKENLELANEKISQNLLPGLSQFEDSLKYDYKWKNKEIDSSDDKDDRNDSGFEGIEKKM